MPKRKKPTNWKVTPKMLQFKQPSSPEFKKLKWVEFCEHFIDYENIEMYLTEAKTTNSKYITLEYKTKHPYYCSIFSVRFSDHKPNIKKEKSNDCNFFVGVTNFKVTNTQDAILATQEWYNHCSTVERFEVEIPKTTPSESVLESKSWYINLYLKIRNIFVNNK